MRHDEAARQGRPANTASAVEITTAAGREPTVDAACWTPADAAELDVLVHALATDYAEHHRRCEACQPCPMPGLWLTHKVTCDVCKGLAPLTHGTYCWARDRFREHFRSCPRCLPCEALQAAIREVGDWRELRLLLSRAEALRARLEERVA